MTVTAMNLFSLSMDVWQEQGINTEPLRGAPKDKSCPWSPLSVSGSHTDCPAIATGHDDI